MLASTHRACTYGSNPSLSNPCSKTRPCVPTHCTARRTWDGAADIQEGDTAGTQPGNSPAGHNALIASTIATKNAGMRRQGVPHMQRPRNMMRHEMDACMCCLVNHSGLSAHLANGQHQNPVRVQVWTLTERVQWLCPHKHIHMCGPCIGTRPHTSRLNSTCTDKRKPSTNAGPLDPPTTTQCGSQEAQKCLHQSLQLVSGPKTWCSQTADSCKSRQQNMQVSEEHACYMGPMCCNPQHWQLCSSSSAIPASAFRCSTGRLQLDAVVTRRDTLFAT